MKTRVNRARRLLDGQTFTDPAIEIAILERAGEFAALPIKTQSDLRSALRLYREWNEEKSVKAEAKTRTIPPQEIGIPEEPAIAVSLTSIGEGRSAENAENGVSTQQWSPDPWTTN